MKHKFCLLMIVVLLISGCSIDEPTVSSVTIAPTLADIATIAPTITAQPEALLNFTDSGQRLGLGRSWDVEMADLDQDGDLDAVVTNDMQGGMPSSVWRNDGIGEFISDDQDLGYAIGLDLEDLDNDGDLDIFFVSWGEPGYVWLNDGSGIFVNSGQELGDAGGWDVALGDLDGDGDSDAVIAHEKADTVWLNDGTGNFSEMDQRLGTTYTAAVGLADFDLDGDIDAITVGWSEDGRLWLNDGIGVFVDSGQKLTDGSIHIHGMVSGDLDGNGAVDVIMTGAPNQVWLNDGMGVFTNSDQRLSQQPADTAALADLDGDGDLDVYMAVGNNGLAQDEIWLNDGSGFFVKSELLLSTGFSSGTVLEDLDGDGDIDIFVTHGELGQSEEGGLPNEVWFNQTN